MHYYVSFYQVKFHIRVKMYYKYQKPHCSMNQWHNKPKLLALYSNLFPNKDNYYLNRNFFYYKTCVISKVFIINSTIATNQTLGYSNITKDGCMNHNNYKSNINNHKSNIYNHLSQDNINNFKANISNHRIFFQLQFIYLNLNMKKSQLPFLASICYRC